MRRMMDRIGPAVLALVASLVLTAMGIFGGGCETTGGAGLKPYQEPALSCLGSAMMSAGLVHNACKGAEDKRACHLKTARAYSPDVAAACAASFGKVERSEWWARKLAAYVDHSVEFAWDTHTEFTVGPPAPVPPPVTPTIPGSPAAEDAPDAPAVEPQG